MDSFPYSEDPIDTFYLTVTFFFTSVALFQWLAMSVPLWSLPLEMSSDQDRQVTSPKSISVGKRVINFVFRRP